MKHSLLPTLIFFCCTLILIVINLFALMNLLSYWITLPLLFLSIYLTLYSFTYRKMYKGAKRH